MEMTEKKKNQKETAIMVISTNSKRHNTATAPRAWQTTQSYNSKKEGRTHKSALLLYLAAEAASPPPDDDASSLGLGTDGFLWQWCLCSFHALRWHSSLQYHAA